MSKDDRIQNSVQIVMNESVNPHTNDYINRNVHLAFLRITHEVLGVPGEFEKYYKYYKYYYKYK